MISHDQHQQIAKILEQIHAKLLENKNITDIERKAWQLRVKRGVYYAPRENEEVFLKLLEEYNNGLLK